MSYGCLIYFHRRITINFKTICFYISLFSMKVEDFIYKIFFYFIISQRLLASDFEYFE